MFSAVLYRSTSRAHLLPLTHGAGRLPACQTSTTRARGSGGGARSLTTPSTEAKPFSEIPGPRRLPFVGSSLSFLSQVGKKPIYQAQKEWMEKYGNVYRIKVPTFPELIMIHDPQDIEVMYRAEGKYPSRAPFQAWKQARDELKMEMAVLLS